MIASNQDVEGGVLVVANLLLTPELPQSRTVFGVTPIRQRLELRDETGDLLLPIVKRRRRRHNQEGTPDIVGFCQVGKQRY